jgi:alkylation response protein AidB-like acyl-CoA dehydrogenase
MLVVSLAAACLDAQRRVITNATVYANDRIHLTAISEFGAIRSKLAEMATLVMLGKALPIEHAKILKIESREAEGVSHQEAELKG